MANKIQGLTLEISGNTKPLTEALKGVNTTLSKSQAELREVDRLLKIDPKNTELLAQKQKLLADSIEGTKERLDMLKEAAKQAQLQLEKGDISQEQFRSLQREIIKTENGLDKLEASAKSLDNAFAASTKQIGQHMQSVGKSFLPVTATVSGFAIAAVDSMDKVDEGLDLVMTKTGATGDAAKKLDEIYKDLAAEIPASFGDIGAAVGEVNTRLEFTGDKLKTASKDFLEFAKVNGTDVNTAVQLVSRAMGDAGIQADEYNSLLDMLTVAGQKSGISIDSLTQNLAKYGAPMRALGISTQEAIAMFAGWEKAGVNTEIAFSGMKKAISNWGASGKDSTEEFKKTLEEIKKAPDIATATAKAIEIFGAKAGPDMADAIRGGRFEFEQYITALQGSAGAVDSTYGMIVDEVDDAQLAIQNFNLALYDIGGTIAKTFGPMLLELAETVKNASSKFSELSPEMQKIVVIILALVAGIAPLLMIIGQVSIGIGALLPIVANVISFLGLLASGIKLLATAFFALTGPIGVIIAVIAALVAGIILLWNKNEGFRKKVTEIWEAIKKTFFDSIEAVKNFFTGLIDFIKELPEKIKQIGKNIAEGFKNGIVEKWEDVKKGVSGFVSKVKKAFTGKDGFDTHSPSRWAKNEVGAMIPLGVARGIDKTANEAVKAADEMAKKVFSASKEWIDERKYYNNLSLAEELQAWERVTKRYVDDSEQKIEAEKEYYRVKQEIAKQIDSLEQKYSDTLANRSKQIFDSFKLFDEIAVRESVTGQTLISNLEDQVGRLDSWKNSLAELTKRGLNEGIIQEIQAMGPSVLEEIDGLLSLSDDDLAKYAALYAEKQRLANEQAVKELTSLRAETDTEIAKLISGVESKFDVGESIGTSFIDGIVNGIKGGISKIQSALGEISAIVPGPQGLADFNANASYATALPVANDISPVETGSNFDSLVMKVSEAVGAALLQGLMQVGDTIFEGIPKEQIIQLNGAEFATITWADFEELASRKGRLFAPNRSEIAAIAMSVMPQGG